MNALYVLYDETCGFCCRCAEWLGAQPKYVPMVCMPAGAPQTKEAFPTLRRTAQKTELIAIDDKGGVYREADAWVAVMWTLKNYRGWAKRLSNPSLRPLARNVFELISTNRHKVSEWLGLQPHPYIARTLVDRYGAPDVPKCADDACEAPAPKKEGPVCPGCWKTVAAGREFCPHCLARLVRGEACPPGS